MDLNNKLSMIIHRFSLIRHLNQHWKTKKLLVILHFSLNVLSINIDREISLNYHLWVDSWTMKYWGFSQVFVSFKNIPVHDNH